MKCKVCGRTREEVENEFDQEVEIKEHQGINKCSKCIREYETYQDVGDSDEPEKQESGNWKDEIFA